MYNFTSDIPFIDADYYDPFENIKKDGAGFYVVLEDGRKVRFPSVMKFKMIISNRDGLFETA